MSVECKLRGGYDGGEGIDLALRKVCGACPRGQVHGRVPYSLRAAVKMAGSTHHRHPGTDRFRGIAQQLRDPEEGAEDHVRLPFHVALRTVGAEVNDRLIVQACGDQRRFISGIRVDVVFAAGGMVPARDLVVAGGDRRCGVRMDGYTCGGCGGRHIGLDLQAAAREIQRAVERAANHLHLCVDRQSQAVGHGELADGEGCGIASHPV